MIDLLRAGTAKHHHGLESGLRIQERLSNAETCGPLIVGYNWFYSKCEAALKPHLWDISDLTISFRFRARKIPANAELTCLGSPLVDVSFPSISTKARALGAMYVLEGSTLGGKTILKTLSRQGVSTDGLRFLDPYGKDAGLCGAPSCIYLSAKLSLIKRAGMSVFRVRLTLLPSLQFACAK